MGGKNKKQKQIIALHAVWRPLGAKVVAFSLAVRFCLERPLTIYFMLVLLLSYPDRLLVEIK